MFWPWCVDMTILLLCLYEIVVSENIIVILIVIRTILVTWLLCWKWVIRSRWRWYLLFLSEFLFCVVFIILTIIFQLGHKKLLQIVQKLMYDIFFSFKRELINLINLFKTTHSLHIMTLHSLLVSVILYHLQLLQILKRTH